MTAVTRTAILQARVRPEIKHASENVLRRIGLNMTEAMELFLRRVIIDQKLPFEVAALDDAALLIVSESWQSELRRLDKAMPSGKSRSRARSKSPKRE